jgi:Fur family peroxide stress response transcriptional regulator
VINKIGKKYSKKRDTILQVIQSTTSHPSAQWVYEKIKLWIPSISLATIYRNINLFRQHGSVVSVGVVDGAERFDGIVTPHPHFVCSRCGMVIDIPCPDMEILKAILGDHGENLQSFIVDYRKTVFYGFCTDCRDKALLLENYGLSR